MAGFQVPWKQWFSMVTHILPTFTTPFLDSHSRKDGTVLGALDAIVYNFMGQSGDCFDFESILGKFQPQWINYGR